MNGTTSPDEASAAPAAPETVQESQPDPQHDGANDAVDGQAGGETSREDGLTASPKRSIEAEAEERELPDAPPPATASNGGKEGNGEEDANSEAETVLTSPVKKREAERQYSEAVKSEKPEEPKLPCLPAAPAQEEDDEADAPGSPDDGVAAAPAKDARDANGDGRVGSDRSDSEPLSDISASRDSDLDDSSRSSSRSRAHSERRDFAGSRKRKYRASSVSLPNKRPSMDVARRRLRDLHSEGGGKEAMNRSMSPKSRSHRRAVSTQSAFADGGNEMQSRPTRRANTQFPVRDPKAVKSAWDESSISSEATSHGKGETRRPQRGVGRSTSTPGRPPGPGHKRHINKYGFTKLAEACENNDLDLVKEWLDKDPEQLELAEFAHNTPLQIASLKGNDVIVKFLIGQGCKVDCANVDKDTPLIDAAENGHLRVVEILLEAGVDPLRENRKGQQALDVVDEDLDNASDIKATLREAVAKWNSDDAKQRREAEEEQRYKAGPAKELHFMARTYENLMKLVTNNDRNSVREFLDARVPVDNAIIAAAAKTGDSYLVSMLLAEITEKKAHQKPEKPMLNVLGTSHFDMVKTLSELEYFNPLWKNRQGRGWKQIAEDRRGPNWEAEVELLGSLQEGAERRVPRRSSSPVTRRDQGSSSTGRRPAPRSGDVSEDEDVAPARKGGRRLMSRRDMRAASGKPVDESSGEEFGDVAAVPQRKERGHSMKPPASPGAKRGGGRPRAKSSCSREGDVEGKTQRRRSGSAREQGNEGEKLGEGLASVDEKMEDAPAPPQPADDQEMTGTVPDSPKRTMEDEAQEAKIKLEELEAQTRREDEDARRIEEAKQAEEEARREEERKAEEARQAEEMRCEEEAKRAEDERKAEAERRQLADEREEAERKFREDFLESLPATLSEPLTLAEDAPRDEAEDVLAMVLERFAPLQAVALKRPGVDSEAGDKGQLFVLNVQAAPLLGKQGLDLLMPDDAPGYGDSCAADWSTLPLSETGSDQDAMRFALSSAAFVDYTQTPAPPSADQAQDPDADTDMHGADDHATNSENEDNNAANDDEPTFEAELAATARRISSSRAAQSQLQTTAVALRWVRLRDVLENLHPVLKEAGVEVPVHRDLQPASLDGGKQGKSGGFFESVRARCANSGAGGGVGENGVRVSFDK